MIPTGQQRNQRLLQHLIRRVGYILLLAIGVLFGASVAMAWSSSAKKLSLSDHSNEGTVMSSVAVAPDGTVHVVWADFSSNGAWPVYYGHGTLNNKGNAVDWDKKYRLSDVKARGDKSLTTLATAVGSDGTVHVAITSNNSRLQYFYNKDGGKESSWKGERNIVKCSWGVDIALDKNNNPYVACAVESGDWRIGYTYRTGKNQWAGLKTVSPDRDTIIAMPKLAVTGKGDNVRVHVVYTVDDKVYYSKGKRGGGFNYDNISDALNVGDANQPAIAADPSSNRLYVGMVHNSQSDNYRAYYSTSKDVGSSWSSTKRANLGNKWPQLVPSMYVANDQLYVANGYVSSDFSETEVYYLTMKPGEGFKNAKKISGGLKVARAASMDAGGPGKVVTFTRNNTGGLHYNVDPGGSSSNDSGGGDDGGGGDDDGDAADGSSIDANIIVNDGNMARSNKVPVVISMKSGKINRYKLWNHGAGEPNKYKEIGLLPAGRVHTVQWKLPSYNNAACRVQKIYARLRNANTGAESKKFTGSVDVDPGVDVNVTMTNPGSGSPSYTAVPFYNLDVVVNSGECNGISKVRVWEEDAQAATLSDVGLADSPPSTMPLSTETQGVHTLTVEVTDGVGHVRSFEKSITLDSVAPTVTSTDTARLQVQDKTSGAVIVETDTNNVDLLFEGLVVQDNLYGTQPQESKPFWGVCVANSLSELAAMDIDQCQSIPVTDATEKDGGYAFTVADWDLGQGITATDGDTVNVYACVMDGANCSDELLSAQVTLNQASDSSGGQTLYLPTVRR